MHRVSNPLFVVRIVESFFQKGFGGKTCNAVLIVRETYCENNPLVFLSEKRSFYFILFLVLNTDT